MKPKIAITMGDAAGIGPEIILKSLNNEYIYKICKPVVFGDLKVLEKAMKIVNLSNRFNVIKDLGDCRFSYGTVDVLNFNNLDINNFNYGIESSMCGKAAVEYTMRAARMCQDKIMDAMVSAPLNKKSMQMANYKYSGQTQIIGELTDSKNYSVMLISQNIRAIMLTDHLALIDACKAVKKNKVYKMIKLANTSLKMIGVSNPIIAVSALNPHSSEMGLFGKEEIKEITPAIYKAKKEKIDVIGPIPADSVFMKARDQLCDVIIYMFHDQANITLKTLSFGKIVVLQIGVPIIRTTVGHGTAFDIAGKNMAKEENLTEAIRVASECFSKNRQIGGKESLIKKSSLN